MQIVKHKSKEPLKFLSYGYITTGSKFGYITTGSKFGYITTGSKFDIFWRFVDFYLVL